MRRRAVVKGGGGVVGNTAWVAVVMGVVSEESVQGWRENVRKGWETGCRDHAS